MTHRGLRALTILLGLALALPAPASGAGPKVSASTETAQGLHRAIFTTEHGRVVLNLPGDMAGGDAVTGTVAAEPAGDSEKEIRKNAEALDAWVVQVEKAGTPVRARILRWTIPAALAGGTAQAILKGPEGSEVARATLPVRHRPSYPTHPQAPAPGDYLVPSVGQADGPIAIEGPFDGAFATTALSVGGREAPKLAESPRTFVARSPRGVLGATALEMKEGGTTVRADFRNITQTLTFLKRELVKDEATVLTAKVEGLDGLDEPIEIRLVNRTPQVVRMEGGDTWSAIIRPLYVEPGGIATFARTLTGIRREPFEIAATVVAEPAGQGPWHALKELARSAEDLGVFIDSAGRDLDAFAAQGGMTPEAAASARQRLEACRDVAAADLKGAKRCAGLALREVPAEALAASIWPSGFDLYRAALRLMIGWLGDGKAEVPFHRMSQAFDFLIAAAEAAGDGEGAKLLRDVKTLEDYVRKNAASRDRLKEVLVKIQDYRPRPKPDGAPPPPAPEPSPPPAGQSRARLFEMQEPLERIDPTGLIAGSFAPARTPARS